MVLWQSLPENTLYCFAECSHLGKTQISFYPISNYLQCETEATETLENVKFVILLSFTNSVRYFSQN